MCGKCCSVCICETFFTGFHFLRLLKSGLNQFFPCNACLLLHTQTHTSVDVPNSGLFEQGVNLQQVFIWWFGGQLFHISCCCIKSCLKKTERCHSSDLSGSGAKVKSHWLVFHQFVLDRRQAVVSDIMWQKSFWLKQSFKFTVKSDSTRPSHFSRHTSFSVRAWTWWKRWIWGREPHQCWSVRGVATERSGHALTEQTELDEHQRASSQGANGAPTPNLS